MRIHPLAAFALAALLTACAGTGQTPFEASAGVLSDTTGMTLYLFDKDVAGSGKSACNGECAQKWPPLLAAADAVARGDHGILIRDDGNRQWSYKGKPLYRWFKHLKPGDMSGDGVNNVWHVARP